MVAAPMTNGNDPYAGDAHDIPLTTRVARNVAVAVAGANLSYVQLGHHIGVVPTALTRRTKLDNEWHLSELDSIAKLIGIAPCMFMANSTSTIGDVMALKRSAIRGFHLDNPNPSEQTLRLWLSVVYSPDYADLVLGEANADVERQR